LPFTKEIEERQKREEEMGEKTAHLSLALKSYQDFVRKSLAIFAKKAKLPVLLEEAITQGDSDAEAEIRNRINRGESVEIKKKPKK
jgi:Ser-tRNA(Ala) deacylase AlaX